LVTVLLVAKQCQKMTRFRNQGKSVAVTSTLFFYPTWNKNSKENAKADYLNSLFGDTNLATFQVKNKCI